MSHPNNKEYVVSMVECFNPFDYLKKNSYSPKIQRSESFNNVSGFVSITLSEASQTLDETSAGAPLKSAFKANHHYPKRVPPCSAGLLRESTELRSKRLEHPEKTNPMPEFSDRAADALERCGVKALVLELLPAPSVGGG